MATSTCHFFLDTGYNQRPRAFGLLCHRRIFLSRRCSPHSLDLVQMQTKQAEAAVLSSSLISDWAAVMEVWLSDTNKEDDHIIMTILLED